MYANVRHAFESSKESENVTILAETKDYRTAEAIVDHLSDHKFPVEHTSITAEGLSFVESVTGRLNFLKAIGRGALRGIGLGIFIGLLLGLFAISFPTSIFIIILWSAFYGALIGALWDGVSYGFSGGKRDFTSVGSIRANSYLVMVERIKSDDAKAILRNSRFANLIDVKM